MRSERRPIICSHCGKEFTDRVILQVDQGRESDRTANLADGSLFTFRCPHCGENSYYNHYLLWVDEAHSVALCNVTCEEEKQAVDEAVSALNAFGKSSGIKRRRFLSSPTHLFEKSQIFSAGLDDRVVEIVKLFLTEQVRASYPEKTITDVLFLGGEEYGLLFLSPDGDLTVPLTRTQLEQAAAGFVFPEPEPERVDARWALSFLTGGKPC